MSEDNSTTGDRDKDKVEEPCDGICTKQSMESVDTVTRGALIGGLKRIQKTLFDFGNSSVLIMITVTDIIKKESFCLSGGVSKMFL
jgi:hypothetical protein